MERSDAADPLGQLANFGIDIHWAKLRTAITTTANDIIQTHKTALRANWLQVRAAVEKVAWHKIVLCAVPFACYLMLFKSYNSLRALTGLDELMKPSLTFLPWLEMTVFHCMPHKIAASIHNPVLDVLAAIPYLLHFVLPVLFVVYLAAQRRSRDIFQFLWCLGWVNFTVVLFQFLCPTAPPWYTDSAQMDATGHVLESALGPPEAGFERVDKLLGFQLFHGIYSRSPLKFGAFPSLHVAWPTVVLACKPWFNSKVGVLHVVWITWAALYSNHHYAVDALMGILIVAFIVGIAQRVYSPFGTRAVAELPVLAPKQQ